MEAKGAQRGDAGASGERAGLAAIAEAASSESASESEWETASLEDQQDGGEDPGPEGSQHGSSDSAEPEEADGAAFPFPFPGAGPVEPLSGTALHLAANNSTTACIPVRCDGGVEGRAGGFGCARSSPAWAMQSIRSRL